MGSFQINRHHSDNCGTGGTECRPALDLSSPAGQGTFDITNIELDGDLLVVHFHGKVEGYGTVIVSHEYDQNIPECSGGTLVGSGQGILDNGDVLRGTHRGTFTRDAGMLTGYFTDVVTNGDKNFVKFEVDLINRSAKVSYYSLN